MRSKGSSQGSFYGIGVTLFHCDPLCYDFASVVYEDSVMSDVAITFKLSEELVKEANALGILSSEHIEALLRSEIESQLAAMVADPDIKRELGHIETEFAITESDGLDREA
jgi:hypothetical protein